MYGAGQGRGKLKESFGPRVQSRFEGLEKFLSPSASGMVDAMGQSTEKWEVGGPPWTTALSAPQGGREKKEHPTSLYASWFFFFFHVLFFSLPVSLGRIVKNCRSSVPH